MKNLVKVLDCCQSHYQNTDMMIEVVQLLTFTRMKAADKSMKEQETGRNLGPWGHPGPELPAENSQPQKGVLFNAPRLNTYILLPSVTKLQQ